MNKQFSIAATFIVASLFFGANAYADAQLGQPITGTIVLNKPQHQLLAGFNGNIPPETKTVVLMNIKLTPSQLQTMMNFDPESSSSKSMQAKTLAAPQGSLPKSADRGMNGTPVLDQGKHGSCVTFANTGAIDALLGKGDYVSQLCSLELGAYFEQKAYLPSGWNGSWGPLVLNQMMSFGIINKTNQKQKTCGGLKEYPARDGGETGSAMTLDEFKESSEDISKKIYWDPLLTFYQRFEWDPTSSKEADDLLIKIKTLIAEKYSNQDLRLTFATQVPVKYCSVGACGRHNARDDTWALTESIKKDRNPELGGHEMVITGYDDDATATDNEGKVHRGLLILRNSWSDYAGDHGTYYMTYDFFKKFVTEVQKVVIEK